MTLKYTQWLLLLLLTGPGLAWALSCPVPPDVQHRNEFGFLAADENHVQPTVKSPVEIRVFFPEAVKQADLSLFTADKDLVRKIALSELAAGVHVVSWDGLDHDGAQVPDEVYNPVLSIITLDDQPMTVDPSMSSGGDILHNLGTSWQWTEGRNIAFALPAASRVLVRIGIQNGPVLKNLAHWVAKPAGKVVVRWDGFDQDGLVPLSERKDLSVLVMGYCLPWHSLIVYGNAKEDYFSYRARKNWVNKPADINRIELHREGQRLEKDYFLPRFQLPELTLEPKTALQKTAANTYSLTRPTSFRLSVPREQRWVLDAAFYEVVYYQNFLFQQEEEQGFMPIYWPVDPQKLGPGRHILTAQISGFGGVFVSRSVAVEVASQ